MDEVTELREGYASQTNSLRYIGRNAVMPLNRRQFIKRTAGAVSVSLVMPKLWLSNPMAQTHAADASRRIFVVIQLAGGNDGLNTVIPYTDPRYSSLRPRIGFKEAVLTSTMLSNTATPLALHPSMTALKGMYDAGKVAVVLGVGYQNPNLSHFTSMDIWETADPTGLAGEGWLGKYADNALVGHSGFPAASIGSALPKALFSNSFVIPDISAFPAYDFLTDSKYAGDRNNQLSALNANYGRSYASGTFVDGIAMTGLGAVAGAAELKNAVLTYSSTVKYPSPNPLAASLQMVAQIVTTIPEANLVYVAMGGFDNHSMQVATTAGQPDPTAGEHATLLKYLSDAVKAFYDDLAAHSLADQTVMMTWSEFGRRVNDNGSNGTDHGTAAPLFVIGNPVQGGKTYGQQPSLTDLDPAGNMKYQVDFREVYATVLDKWLSVDSRTVLGGQFGNAGFLG
jgi:uncharacterized protein (DUF1501 family)